MSPAHTYPPSEPHRIMTSVPRARTVLVCGGLMGSLMRRQAVRGFDKEEVIFNREKKVLQEEQNAEDEKVRKEAMKDLINSWQERLQLISVITTFFATTEAAMLVNTKPAGMSDFENRVLKASNASFLGSLVLHVYASILSFLGAFLLVNYKLREASRAELIMEGIMVTSSPHEGSGIKDSERDAVGSEPPLQKSNSRNIPSLVEPPLVFSADPHIEQVGLLPSHMSSQRLLSRIHTVCVLLAATGFILALVGIVSYAWALQPTSVGVFTTVCLGGALLSMLTFCI